MPLLPSVPVLILFYLWVLSPCILYLGSIKRLKPSFSASPMRCSMRFTGRISPDRPISPAMHTSGSMAVSMLLERMALMTARSIAGSFTFNPPAILRNTSFCASLKPTRFPIRPAAYSCGGCRTLWQSVVGYHIRHC